MCFQEDSRELMQIWYVAAQDEENAWPARSLDFCQFGTKWRKRTGLLCGNLDRQDLERLERLNRQCRGSHQLRSQTQQKHLQLTGTRCS